MDGKPCFCHCLIIVKANDFTCSTAGSMLKALGEWHQPLQSTLTLNSLKAQTESISTVVTILTMKIER